MDLTTEEIDEMQNVNNILGENYSNPHDHTPENDYTKSIDPVNVFSNRLEDMLLTTGMYSFMLRKRQPKKSQFKDWRFNSNFSTILIILEEQSIFKNKFAMTVEESIANLRGKNLSRYKSIVEWKKKKGIPDDYGHVKFLYDEDESGKRENEDSPPKTN